MSKVSTRCPKCGSELIDETHPDVVRADSRHGRSGTDEQMVACFNCGWGAVGWLGEDDDDRGPIDDD